MNYSDCMSPKEFCKLMDEEGVTVYAAILHTAGYTFVPCPGTWEDVHAWMKDKYGEGNYTWTGEKFWFDNEEDKTEFKRYFGWS